MLVYLLFQSAMPLGFALDSQEATFIKQVLFLGDEDYGLLVSVAGAGIWLAQRRVSNSQMAVIAHVYRGWCAAVECRIYDLLCRIRPPDGSYRLYRVWFLYFVCECGIYHFFKITCLLI